MRLTSATLTPSARMWPPSSSITTCSTCLMCEFLVYLHSCGSVCVSLYVCQIRLFGRVSFSAELPWPTGEGIAFWIERLQVQILEQMLLKSFGRDCKLRSPCVYSHAHRSHTHVKEPGVHFRVRGIMETVK